MAVDWRCRDEGASGDVRPDMVGPRQGERGDAPNRYTKQGTGASKPLKGEESYRPGSKLRTQALVVLSTALTITYHTIQSHSVPLHTIQSHTILCHTMLHSIGCGAEPGYQLIISF